MTRLLWVAWVGVACGALAAPPPSSTAETMAELRAIEAASYRPGGADALRLKYQDQARQRPNDAMPRVMIAWTTLPSEDSWNQLKAIAPLHPDNLWVKYGMGRIYIGWKGMSELAKTEFETVLKQDPTFFPALVGQGDLARAKQDWATAESKYKAALAINDDPFARAGLGLAYANQGKTGEALVELKKAIAGHPQQPQALTTLVELAVAAKDPEVIGAAEALAELRPKDRAARKMLAELRFERGEKAAAAKEYEKLLRLGDPEPAVLERLTTLQHELGDLEGELRTQQTLAALDRSSATANLRLAELKRQKNDLEGAEKDLVEAVTREPENAKAHAALGTVKLERGKSLEALESLREAVRLNPSDTEAKTRVSTLEADFKLPKTRAKNGFNAVYASVRSSLSRFYDERKKANPGLAGTYKIRVKVRKDSTVEAVETVEDTVKDPQLFGHVYFSLKDAQYPKQKAEPVFEFVLGEAKK